MRWSTSPPSRTSTARSRRQASSSPPTSTAPTCCWRPPATPASATSRSRPTRSTATSSWAPPPRSLPLNPSSPYSASKAGGDLLVSAFARTYGAEALIIRASNNYGPRQHPEKLIPLCILNALAGDPLPVYGDGMQVRNWLFVEDCCSAVDIVLERGEPGEVYNVGGPGRAREPRGGQADPRSDRSRRIADLLRHRSSRATTAATRSPPARLEALGWKAAVGFDEGIERTVAWYRENERWWAPIRSGEYREYYERQYGKSPGGRMSFRRLPTEIDGVVLLEPDVHGDERGFLVETFRAEAMKLARRRCRLRPGEPQPVLRPGAARTPPAARPGEARSLCSRPDLRRRRGSPAGLPHLQTLGGVRPRRRRASAALHPRRLRPRRSASSPTRPTSSTAVQLLRPRARERRSPGTTQRSRSTGRSPTRSSPIETGTLRRLADLAASAFEPGVRLGHVPNDDADLGWHRRGDQFSRCVTLRVVSRSVTRSPKRRHSEFAVSRTSHRIVDC